VDLGHCLHQLKHRRVNVRRSLWRKLMMKKFVDVPAKKGRSASKDSRERKVSRWVIEGLLEFFWDLWRCFSKTKTFLKILLTDAYKATNAFNHIVCMELIKKVAALKKMKRSIKAFQGQGREGDRDENKNMTENHQNSSNPLKSIIDQD
jgi:hypothetical protein